METLKGVRKLIFCGFALLSISILAGMGKITADQYVTALEYLAGFFAGANAVENVAQAMADKE